MKVLNVCTSDYANFAHDNAKSLRSVGIDCRDIKTSKHYMNYQSQSEIVSINEVKKIAKDYDIIQIFHSSITILNEVRLSGKKLVVYHTGSNYRKGYSQLNRVFNRFVDLSFIALCEFKGLGAKNEHYIVGATHTGIPKISTISKPYTFAHFPSDAEVKGTSKIIELLYRTKGWFELKYSIDKVNNREHIERMNDCHVYIELFKPELKGKPYGSWGITALEAAALGKVVVTQNLRNEVYTDAYGECPLFLAKDEQDFIDKINYLASIEPKEMLNLQNKTLEWVLKNHSYTATGNRLKTILNELYREVESV